jgi:glycerol-1-phosphate dehydrogenase [NAD(P)+]
VTQRVVLPDPADLDGLRRRLTANGRPVDRRPIGLGSVRIGSNALAALPDVVAEVRREGPVVVVVDETPMVRGAADLKAMAVAALSARFPTRVATIRARGAELHADDDALDQAETALRGAGCVVSIGSGTITDVAKEASRRAGGAPFVVVQTAVSVNAFSDDMAVLLRDGVKRTVPSRWPDVLIVDLEVIADAPAQMNRAGFGELCSMFTAPADWYLADAAGMAPGFDPEIVSLFREGADALLRGADRVAANDPDMLAEMAGRMTLTGIGMGVAGRTAPLSGTEHVFSHLLDMAAERAGQRLAFHGAQVGVASVMAATIWHDTLDRFDPDRLRDSAALPDAASVERKVRLAFGEIDPTGRMAAECWRDVERKLTRWNKARPAVRAMAADWDRHRAALADLVTPPAVLAVALEQAGAPSRAAELDPPPRPEVVRWALQALPLMRDRFTVVDLRFFTGSWEAPVVDELLERSGILEARR